MGVYKGEGASLTLCRRLVVLLLVLPAIRLLRCDSGCGSRPLSPLTSVINSAAAAAASPVRVVEPPLPPPLLPRAAPPRPPQLPAATVIDHCPGGSIAASRTITLNNSAGSNGHWTHAIGPGCVIRDGAVITFRLPDLSHAASSPASTGHDGGHDDDDEGTTEERQNTAAATDNNPQHNHSHPITIVAVLFSVAISGATFINGSRLVFEPVGDVTCNGSDGGGRTSIIQHVLRVRITNNTFTGAAPVIAPATTRTAPLRSAGDVPFIDIPSSSATWETLIIAGNTFARRDWHDTNDDDDDDVMLRRKEDAYDFWRPFLIQVRQQPQQQQPQGSTGRLTVGISNNRFEGAKAYLNVEMYYNRGDDAFYSTTAAAATPLEDHRRHRRINAVATFPVREDLHAGLRQPPQQTAAALTVSDNVFSAETDGGGGGGASRGAGDGGHSFYLTVSPDTTVEDDTIASSAPASQRDIKNNNHRDDHNKNNNENRVPHHQQPAASRCVVTIRNEHWPMEAFIHISGAALNMEKNTFSRGLAITYHHNIGTYRYSDDDQQHHTYNNGLSKNDAPPRAPPTCISPPPSAPPKTHVLPVVYFRFCGNTVFSSALVTMTFTFTFTTAVVAPATTAAVVGATTGMRIRAPPTTATTTTIATTKEYGLTAGKAFRWSARDLAAMAPPSARRLCAASPSLLLWIANNTLEDTVLALSVTRVG